MMMKRPSRYISDTGLGFCSFRAMQYGRISTWVPVWELPEILGRIVESPRMPLEKEGFSKVSQRIDGP